MKEVILIRNSGDVMIVSLQHKVPRCEGQSVPGDELGLMRRRHEILIYDLRSIRRGVERRMRQSQQR